MKRKICFILMIMFFSWCVWAQTVEKGIKSLLTRNIIQNMTVNINRN